MKTWVHWLILVWSLGGGVVVGAEPHTSTASPNVFVLPALDMPGLNRQRVLRVYLPPGYATSQRRYPVVYMHDGQNLFDAATSYAGEWGVDETLNELARSKGLELIVVGVDNGQEKRMAELNPWGGLVNRVRFGKAEGEFYMAFIVDTVKPWIDRQYRTLPTREHTAILGSSMGGLISDYAIHRYPQVFSKAGVFSPSYWVSDEAYASASAKPLPSDARVFLLAGGREGDTAAGVTRMEAVLKKVGMTPANLRTRIVAEGEHNEAFWRGEFPAAVTWLFGAMPESASTQNMRLNAPL